VCCVNWLDPLAREPDDSMQPSPRRATGCALGADVMFWLSCAGLLFGCFFAGVLLCLLLFVGSLLRRLSSFGVGHSHLQVFFVHSPAYLIMCRVS
jgi:hypothetical protein